MIWPDMGPAVERIADDVQTAVGGMGIPFEELRWRCHIEGTTATVRVCDDVLRMLVATADIALPAPVERPRQLAAGRLLARLVCDAVVARLAMVPDGVTLH